MNSDKEDRLAALIAAVERVIDAKDAFFSIRVPALTREEALEKKQRFAAELDALEFSLWRYHGSEKKET